MEDWQKNAVYLIGFIARVLIGFEYEAPLMFFAAVLIFMSID